MSSSGKHYTDFGLPEIQPMAREVILHYVKDETWQALRKDMKGKSTEDKLKMLRRYLKGPGLMTYEQQRAKRIQVWNYLNALKRGGQLDKDGRIQR